MWAYLVIAGDGPILWSHGWPRLLRVQKVYRADRPTSVLSMHFWGNSPMSRKFCQRLSRFTVSLCFKNLCSRSGLKNSSVLNKYDMFLCWVLVSILIIILRNCQSSQLHINFRVLYLSNICKNATIWYSYIEKFSVSGGFTPAPWPCRGSTSEPRWELSPWNAKYPPHYFLIPSKPKVSG